MGRKKVLVVDDNEQILELMKEYVGMLEMDAITASDGEEGLRLAKKEKPDAILLDIMMPKMAGDEMAARLMEDPDTADIPVAFLTGLADAGDTAKTTPGGYRMISKELSQRELQEQLREFLA